MESVGFSFDDDDDLNIVKKQSRNVGSSMAWTLMKQAILEIYQVPLDAAEEYAESFDKSGWYNGGRNVLADISWTDGSNNLHKFMLLSIGYNKTYFFDYCESTNDFYFGTVNTYDTSRWLTMGVDAITLITKFDGMKLHFG